jgi:hypothetical protein
LIHRFDTADPDTMSNVVGVFAGDNDGCGVWRAPYLPGDPPQWSDEKFGISLLRVKGLDADASIRGSDSSDNLSTTSSSNRQTQIQQIRKDRNKDKTNWTIIEDWTVDMKTGEWCNCRSLDNNGWVYNVTFNIGSETVQSAIHSETRTRLNSKDRARSLGISCRTRRWKRIRVETSIGDDKSRLSSDRQKVSTSHNPLQNSSVERHGNSDEEMGLELRVSSHCRPRDPDSDDDS